MVIVPRDYRKSSLVSTTIDRNLSHHQRPTAYQEQPSRIQTLTLTAITLSILLNMPSTPQNPQSGHKTAGAQPQDKSNNTIIKESGFSNMNHLMQSYGLKIQEPDHVYEAKQIIEGFRQIGQQQYDAQQQGKGQRK
jgi:hypothetical protein